MNYHFKTKPEKVDLEYFTSKSDTKKSVLDSHAFNDLIMCFGNCLRRESNLFNGDIKKDDSLQAILWREADDQYKYYTGESSLD